jgi:hypothetical protein
MVLALATGIFAALPGAAADAQRYCPPEEGPCIPEPELPPGSSPPEPGSIEFTARTTNASGASLGMKLRIGKETDTWALQRQSGTSWVTIRSGVGRSYAYYYSTTHAGLTPDTRYCYRLQATNEVGTSSSPLRCAYTRDGRNLDAYRVQARISTANVEDAGTSDEWVRVAVNGPYPHVMPESRWLDHSQNDFERGGSELYDLAAGRIGELGDLTALTLENRSDDDWCVKRIEIVVNGKPAFVRDWGIQTCLWIGADSASTRVVFTHADLRASPYWSRFESASPFTGVCLTDDSLSITRRFPRTQIEETVESIVGHALHDNPLYWGHIYWKPVEAKREAAQVLGVDVDLAADVLGWDPEVDVDFDVRVNAELGPDGRPDVGVAMENFSVDAEYETWQEIVSVGLVELVEREIEDQVAQEVPRFVEQTEIDTDLVDQITASVNSAGDLVFTAIIRPGPGCDS